MLCLLEFEQPIFLLDRSLLIASRLDSDIHLNQCRLAYYGNVCHRFTKVNYRQDALPRLKVFKEKSRSGQVERLLDSDSVIVRGLFKKQSDLSKFHGMHVRLSSGDVGRIEGAFGQSGKVRVGFSRDGGLAQATIDGLPKPNSKKAAAEDVKAEKARVITAVLSFHKFIYSDELKNVVG